MSEVTYRTEPDAPWRRGWANISRDKRHRYTLDRRWDDDLPVLVWVMLNPSTADGDVDDHTIRRCLYYSKLWGYGGLTVVNLFSLRETNPLRMLQQADAGGGRFNRSVRSGSCIDKDVVVAWGANAQEVRHYAWAALADIKKVARRVDCLGRTADNHPRHPARLRNDVERIPIA